MDKAWQFGGYDEDALSGVHINPSHRPKELARLRTKRILQLIRRLMSLVSRRPSLHFSASLSFFIIMTRTELVGVLREIETDPLADADTPESESEQFAYQIGQFMAHRLFAEEPDEIGFTQNSTQNFSRDDANLRYKLWAKELALVHLEARDELTEDQLPAEASELADSIRRLQILLHAPIDSVEAADMCDEMWDQYTVRSNRDEPLPNPHDGELKAVFFYMILILKWIRQDFYAREVSEPSSNDDDDDGDNSNNDDRASDNDELPFINGRTGREWFEVAAFVNQMMTSYFGESFEEQQQQRDDPQLKTLRTIFTTVVDLAEDSFGRHPRHRNIHLFHELRRLAVDWRRPVSDAPRFAIMEQRRLEEILAHAVWVMHPLFDQYLDLARQGRASGAWRLDLQWIERLRDELMDRRPLDEDEDGEGNGEENGEVWATIDRYLDATEWLLRQLWQGDILDAVPILTRQRLMTLQRIQEAWERGERGPQHPRLLRPDCRQLDDIHRRLITALREIYVRDDQYDDNEEEEVRAAGRERNEVDQEDRDG